MSASFDNVFNGKYPAKSYAKRVVEYIRTGIPAATGIIYLEGQYEQFYEDVDELIFFRQRRAFTYLTGIADRAGCHLIYDIASDTMTVFVPQEDVEQILWSGKSPSSEQVLKQYDVDHVLPDTELGSALAEIGRQQRGTHAAVFAIAGRFRQKFHDFENRNFDILGEAIEECRIVKDDFEIALIKKANEISCAAHRAVLKQVKNFKNEAEIDSLFTAECMRRGTKKQAYPSIVASGINAASMHYESNNQDLIIDNKAKDLVLVDAGCEWDCYGSDITRTFPLSGRFSKNSRRIYDIVLQMQLSCIAALKEGVEWEQIHTLAHTVAIDGLLSIGILRGNPKKIFAARTSTAFMPYGVSHFLGMDTHDVGGKPVKDETDLLFKYLRVRRSLPAGSVVTVEPGPHFSPHVIRPYLESPQHNEFINEAILDECWAVGGI
ncbi:Xaa-Pro aminopeptidase [Pestalotiopsis fici W106-1]|uniref:Xaa-Pro aminopeptidase n=1 Tax=Pestalotiopsis fici (strain W106-1 / CGMCC3.15140) TaxID=1229662 RepID=W3WWX5_PESFW|nr:Xaa-Pro aminopeptidase [Pestalotiopsis fici W106-1]ETS77632.1 Xaa-Pro aminopeptidase [Pestalotiopsis fici W106-1]